MKLSKQVAIITGSTEGIGFAIAQSFLENGALVTISGRDQHKMDAALSRLSKFDINRIHCVLGDVTDTSKRTELVTQTIDRFGSLDILVNNAGGGSEMRWLEDVSDEDLRFTLITNLESAFALCRLVVPFMRDQGNGRIVNISSVAGRHKARLSGPQYAAAKAGILGMTRHLAWDLGQYGITVNAVAPGFVMTDRAWRKWEKRSEHEKTSMLEGVPVGRFGEPKEIAAAVLYLSSPEAAYTNGVCIDVNGGSYMG